MKFIKIIVVSLMGLFVFLLSFGKVIVSEAASTLPPGMVIADSEGIYATSEGEYYIDLVDVLPGESYEKEITIRSLDLEEPFSLGLRVEEVTSKGSVFWKEHITLTLTLDGKEIYHGPILGDDTFDWSKVPLELGVCKYGSDKILRATFTLDSSLTNEDLREASNLDFYWTFVGTKDQQPTKPTGSTEPLTSDSSTPISSDSGTRSGPEPSRGDMPNTGGNPQASGSGKRLPQTGEEIVYMFLSGMLLVLIALFLWKKRREEEQG
ncbi:LPXTG cell wall anchor domain-containing protein [Candidatus Enterococcus ferrettii]|uniref:Gram-positive cocci surface proteins LPxTG domain-containing protein n=1 Tax=Candidatus Enterococcus ferrettii TaxID=2815324 RepID=A0ABV0EQZ8_9ENTE|nr:LPXTG cell wall anchor domain-containing protein [Enterococcus sp. 665A]MBO1339798.1 LPXTG cell wall anchor domain-containing protein [Enterococcus sp. 665A]